MKTSSIFKIISLIGCIIIFTSCSAEDGEDGAIGPQGPQGEQGAVGPPGEQGEQGEQGPTGATGQAGADGEDGNANIIYSDWMDVNWNTRNDAQLKQMRIPIDQISLTELRSNTLVYMYLTQYATNSIYPMPSSGRWSNTWYSFTFGDTSFAFTGIIVRLESTNGVDLTEFQHSAFRGNAVRYVLVPRSLQTGKLDYSNYEAVKAFYSIPD